MADDKIVHRVSLEGADDVANKLKKIGDVGSDAFKKVKQYADDSSSGVAKFGDGFAAIEGKTEGSRLAAERLREAVHTLHPVLDEAGLGLGNL